MGFRNGYLSVRKSLNYLKVLEYFSRAIETLLEISGIAADAESVSDRNSDIVKKRRNI